MNDKTKLKGKMEQYYQLTAQYRITTVEAMSKVRKRKLFKKCDFSDYIQRFRQHIEEAEKLNIKAFTVSEDDHEAKKLVELLQRSVLSFIVLCEENIRFYDIAQRKQYRRNGVTLKDYAEATRSLEGVLAGAVKDLGVLEQAYKEYCADDFTDQ